MADNSWIEERGAVIAHLEANRDRRHKAELEVSGGRDELRTLLFRGQAAAIEVADMAEAAEISRDTAHTILKEGGVMSWKQKQAWAADIMSLVPRGTYEQNEFRMFLQTMLYKALGSNPEDLPRSVQGVIDEATRTMHEVAGRPNFKPTITDPAKMSTFEWPVEPFEIVQRGQGVKATFQVRHGSKVGLWRSSGDEVARDLKAMGGERPAFIDRTGPECVTSDRRRIGWDVLRDI
jgi:hypothetical protein